MSEYTLIQLLETSNITAHFIDHPTPERDSVVFLNIFSCALFLPNAPAAFRQELFDAQEVDVVAAFRGPTQPSSYASGGEQPCQRP